MFLSYHGLILDFSGHLLNKNIYSQHPMFSKMIHQYQLRSFSQDIRFACQSARLKAIPKDLNSFSCVIYCQTMSSVSFNNIAFVYDRHYARDFIVNHTYSKRWCKSATIVFNPSSNLFSFSMHAHFFHCHHQLLSEAMECLQWTCLMLHVQACLLIHLAIS